MDVVFEWIETLSSQLRILYGLSCFLCGTFIVLAAYGEPIQRNRIVIVIGAWLASHLLLVFAEFLHGVFISHKSTEDYGEK